MNGLTITELGVFSAYTPEPYPEAFPPGVMFSRRASDGADFYSLVQGETPELAPEPGVLFAIGLPLAAGGLEIQAVYDEPDRVVPSGGISLLRIEGYTGANALEDLGLGRKVWHPGTATLVSVLPDLADITDRQFADGLWDEGVITYEEADAFVSNGSVPAALEAILALLPDDDTGKRTPRKTARNLVRGAKTYRFADPLVEFVREALEATDPKWTAAFLRDRWTAWGAL